MSHGPVCAKAICWEFFLVLLTGLHHTFRICSFDLQFAALWGGGFHYRAQGCGWEGADRGTVRVEDLWGGERGNPRAIDFNLHHTPPPEFPIALLFSAFHCLILCYFAGLSCLL